MATSVIPPPPDAEIPPPPDAVAATGGAAPLDLIGQIRARLTQEPPPGSPRDNPVARSIRNLGRFVTPGSWPGLAGLTASMAIPGSGLAVSALRTGAAAAGGAGIEAVRGGEPGRGALEAGGQAFAGEALGGAARAASRYALSRLDPLARNVADVIGNLVPAFKGATPRSTLVKAMGTEGQVALSRQYGLAVDTAIEQAGNPTFGGGIKVSPKVAALLQQAGKMPPQASPVPGYEGRASDIWSQIKSEKNRLLTMARDPARVKDVHLRLDEVHAAEQAFAKAIEARLPPDQQGVFAAANAEYRKGKEVQRLFAPTGKMTSAKAQKILGPGERLALDQPTLAANLMLRSGRLQEALGPEGYAALQAAIQRGGELGARDVPGVTPHFRLHGLGPVPLFPTLYGLPHAPRQIGRPEVMSSLVADTVRRLGTRGTGAAIEAETPRQSIDAPKVPQAVERVSRSNPAVQAAKKAGLSDAEIARRYGLELVD